MWARRQTTYGSYASPFKHVDISPIPFADPIDTVCFEVGLISELGLASLPVPIFFFFYLLQKKNGSIQEYSWFMATVGVPSPLERCANGPTSSTHRGSNKINRSEEDRKPFFPHINLAPCL